MHRILLREYGRAENISSLANTCQISVENMRNLLSKANDRIIKALSLDSAIFILDSDSVRAINVAGLIRLSTKIELEVVPKYLGFCEDDVNWKEDFFLLSTLAKHGRLLEGENIHTDSGFRSTLYDLAGRVLAENFVPLKRQLLRKYRRDQFIDYSIDGEINFEDAFVRQPEGIPQEKVSFDKKNEYNATILAAMRHVQPHITDIKVQRILQDSIVLLQPQNPIRIDRPRLTLPSRDLQWKIEYDLAYDIIHELGAIFTDGKILSPGFIVSTWQIWEWLLTTAIRIGESNLKVVGKKPSHFGSVENHLQKRTQQQLCVYPDISVIESETGNIVYLVDAKYKLASLANKEANRSDLYEALAFCQSTGCKYMFLVYPDDPNFGGVGSVTLTTTYRIEGNTIFAIKVSMQGIADPGGLRRFSNILINGIKAILEQKTSEQAN